MYRDYVELMKMNNSNNISDVVWFNLKIIQVMFEFQMSLEEIAEIEAHEILYVSKVIHFILQDIITPKFLELDENPIEKEESAFDEYDIENGYEEKKKINLWEASIENVDRVIKIAIKLLNNSYTQCLETDIMVLLDHMKFEIKTIKEDS